MGTLIYIELDNYTNYLISNPVNCCKSRTLKYNCLYYKCYIQRKTKINELIIQNVKTEQQNKSKNIEIRRSFFKWWK